MTQHPDIQRLRFRDRSTSYAFITTDDYTAGTGAVKIATKGAKFILCIQKIVLAVTTDNAAQQIFQSTTKVLATSKISPGVGPITWDFGHEGIELAAGESLLHDMSAAGMAGSVTITAYEKPDPAQSLTPNKSVGTGDSF